MKSKTPFDKIDSILEYICKANNPPYRTDGQIYKDNVFDNNSKELFEILLKLEKDNYIEKQIGSENTSKYYSTFDGRMFLAKGAYKQTQSEEEQKRAELERIEKFTKRNNSFLTYGTVFGSIIALGLLFLEILKYLSCGCK